MHKVLKPYAAFVVLLLFVSTIHAHAAVDETKTVAAEQRKQLVAKSAAIVRGRVVDLKQDRLHADSGSSLKAFHVRVLEVLKSDHRFGVGDIVEVHLVEAGAPANSEPIVVEGVEMGDELLLFLERGKSGRYMPILALLAPSD